VSTEVGRLADFPARLETVEREIRALIEGLDGAQLNWQPETRKWSILQVLEHLALSAELYLAPLTTAIERGHADAVTEPEAQPKARLIEGLFLRSLRSRVKLKAPPLVAVRGASDLDPEQVLGRWAASHGALIAAADRGRALDPNRVRITSPLASVLKLGLGVAFEVLLAHEQRHTLQIRRILDDPGFPRR
jgi:hypothetical protein